MSLPALPGSCPSPPILPRLLPGRAAPRRAASPLPLFACGPKAASARRGVRYPISESLMFRSLLLLSAAASALFSASALAQESTESVTVTAEKLAAARNAIQTQTGASTYTITAKDILAQPGGDGVGGG